MVKTSTAVPRRVPKVPGRNGYSYKPQYGLIVKCKDEAEQISLFGRLSELGFAPKVVCV